MSQSTSPRSVRIDVLLPADHPRLLEGLDLWQQLGLLSESYIQQLGQTQLVCALQTVPVPVAIDRLQPSAPLRQERSPAAARPSLLTRWLQSLRAEISVIWLLFLGVFLVVVSSGVLAASQWQNFSAIGQYGILGSYTLAFWGASVWTQHQPRLRLTAQMLRITTLLLIPINFWVIDELRVWSQTTGWAMAVIAALSLSAILVQLLHPTLTNLPHPRLLLVSSLSLSWLHWGWQGSGVPLIATYAGTIAAAVALLYQDQPEQNQPQPNEDTPLPRDLSPGILTVALATLFLIVRAIFAAAVPIAQLGLALGICGWLLGWLSRRRSSQIIWTRVGALLLTAGWLVSVSTEPPIQAIAISGLGLWLLRERLLRLGKAQDLSVLFLVGLQAYWLLWRVFPVEVRQQILIWCANIAGASFTPAALAGVALFPYIGLALGLASRLRRQSAALALQAEWLTLVLGIGLSALSLSNPLLRSINLLLSALALATVVRRRSPPRLVYFTHTVALAAVASALDWLLPDLSRESWAALLLVAMLAEWGGSVSTVPTGRTVSHRLLWRQSAWHLGLVLAGLSYALLLEPPAHLWNVAWLVVPAALTLLSDVGVPDRSRLAVFLSSMTLILVQPLTLPLAVPRLLGLALATGLMVRNTQKLQQLAAAALTIAFALGLAGTLVEQGFGDRLTVEWTVNLLAIATLILWLLCDNFRRRAAEIPRLYAQAADGWAIVLACATLLILTLYTLVVYLDAFDVAITTVWLGATLLTLVAIGYRCRQQSSNLAFYGLAWSAELLAVQGLVWVSPDSETLSLRLAIVNLALGLLTQVLGDIWTHRTRQPYQLSWHVIPLLYAGLGLALAQNQFTETTGFYALALALVGIGVGRRHPSLQPLTILALLTASVAAYELLVYQLLQAQTGSLGDGVVLLAALAVTITVGYRLFSRWLLPYVRLSAEALTTIADLHWFVGSCLLLLALLTPLSTTGSWLWVGVAAILAIDAALKGRSEASWTYLGILTATLTIAHALYLLAADPEALLVWAGAIASGFAVLMYQLPWAQWGWTARPWQRSATVLPGAIVLLTLGLISIPSLLLVAACYAWFARASEQVRLSYISLALADWAMLRWLAALNAQEPLWFAAVFGGSLLYVAQLDPGLRSSSDREKRHWLRSLALALIGLTGIYQSETSLTMALLTLGFSVVWILVGLALRTRAFLYIGTLIFILQTLRQLWLLISEYSLLLWAIGIVLGLAFIWVAATFEARRSQVSAIVQSWLTGLEAWE